MTPAKTEALAWVNGIRATYNYPALAEWPPNERTGPTGARSQECPVAQALKGAAAVGALTIRLQPGHTRLMLRRQIPEFVNQAIREFDAELGYE